MTSSCHLSWLGLKGRHMGGNHMTGSCQLLLFGWFLLRTGSFDDAIWFFSGLSLLLYHLPPGGVKRSFRGSSVSEALRGS